MVSFNHDKSLKPNQNFVMAAVVKKNLKLAVIWFILQGSDTANSFVLSFRLDDLLDCYIMCVFLSAEGKRTTLREEAGENQCSGPVGSRKETELADGCWVRMNWQQQQRMSGEFDSLNRPPNMRWQLYEVS